MSKKTGTSLTNNMRKAIEEMNEGNARVFYSAVREGYKVIRNGIDAKVALSFHIGDRVEFMTKKGIPITGVVTKKGPKNIMIEQDAEKKGWPGRKWTVHPSFLSHVKE